MRMLTEFRRQESLSGVRYWERLIGSTWRAAARLDGRANIYLRYQFRIQKKNRNPFINLFS